MIEIIDNYRQLSISAGVCGPSLKMHQHYLVLYWIDFFELLIVILKGTHVPVVQNDTPYGKIAAVLEY